MDQFLEHVAAAFNDRGKTVERPLGSGAVPVFEFLQAVHLKLFLPARRADHFDRRRRVGFITISVQANDGPGAVIDLLFVPMRGRLDLAALIALVDGR